MTAQTQRSMLSYRLEPLEPRLLLSHAPPVVMVDVAADPMLSVQAALVADARVLTFDSSRDSAAQVIERTRELARQSGWQIESLSIISHGRIGVFGFGGGWVDVEAVNAQEAMWQSLGEALAEHAEIRLYGCNVVDASQGAAVHSPLLERLVALTGARVLASDDMTGRGGDWTLEISTGPGSATDGPVRLDVASQLPLQLPVTDPIDFSTYTIDTYGGAQDATPANWQVLGAGSTLRIWGNTWKKITAGPYTIDADTILEFDFTSNIEGEVQGIGFDNDLNISPPSTFWLYGNQNWGIVDYHDYAGSAPAPKHYAIPVGAHFTGSFSYMVFANDDDANSVAESIFSNVRLYQNVPPTAADDAATAQKDAAETVGVIANDTDANGDAFSVTAIDAASANGGAVVNNGDGTITYTPPAAFTGTDTFGYTITDTNGTTDTATVTITVNAPPELVRNLGASVADEQSVAVTAAMLRATDAESPAGLVQYTLSAAPTQGQLLLGGLPLAAGATFSQNDINAGLLNYDHAGAIGTDGFTFTITDGDGGVIAATTFSISIAASPVALFSAGARTNSVGDSDDPAVARRAVWQWRRPAVSEPGPLVRVRGSQEETPELVIERTRSCLAGCETIEQHGFGFGALEGKVQEPQSSQTEAEPATPTKEMSRQGAIEGGALSADMADETAMEKDDNARLHDGERHVERADEPETPPREANVREEEDRGEIDERLAIPDVEDDASDP